MEVKTKPRTIKKEMNNEDRYQYAYKVKDDKIIKFYGDEEIKKEFDVHHYGESGTLYYRK